MRFWHLNIAAAGFAAHALGDDVFIHGANVADIALGIVTVSVNVIAWIMNASEGP